MSNMIQLTGINKIYRTNEIETQALENVNLSVERKIHFAEHYRFAG